MVLSDRTYDVEELEDVLDTRAYMIEAPDAVDDDADAHTSHDDVADDALPPTRRRTRGRIHHMVVAQPQQQIQQQQVQADGRGGHSPIRYQPP